ncbi:hypothetical protein TN53_11845 [Streptomyces sp. WM6386]|nr:hypothetical protein TN53_11845 [Streptomyces sp. WM6386]
MHALLWDKRRRVVGTVETIGYRITLRPEGGGREWDPEWADVRPATEAHRRASRMRTGVATANRRSRGEVL